MNVLDEWDQWKVYGLACSRWVGSALGRPELGRSGGRGYAAGRVLVLCVLLARRWAGRTDPSGALLMGGGFGTGPRALFSWEPVGSSPLSVG
jgi:hypothetical protein